MNLVFLQDNLSKLKLQYLYPKIFLENNQILGQTKCMKRKIMAILRLLVHFYSCFNISVNL